MAKAETMFTPQRAYRKKIYSSARIREIVLKTVYFTENCFP